MDCLKDIIGISRTDCECIDVDPKYQVSKSGIYIDEVEGGLKPSAIDKIDCQSFVDKMVQARKRATDMFIESILAEYATESYRKIHKDFKGNIAKKTYVRTLSTFKYAGLVLRTKMIKGANITIKSIGLIIDQESDVTIQVYKGYRNSDQITLLHSIPNIPTIKNIANQYDLPNPLVLPLVDELEEPIDYYFVYDTEEYGNPKDNKASCSCGGMDAILKSYVSVAGVASNSLGNLSKVKRTLNANGLFLGAEIKCSTRDTICELINIDESNTIAHSIAYKAQELLIEDLMSSGNINKYTQLSKEHLWGKRNHFRKEFDDRVIWLTQTYPMNLLSDCVVCTDRRMTRMLIR